MFWRINLISFIIIFSLSCSSDNQSESQEITRSSSNYLIQAEELLEEIEKPYIKVIDLRKSDSYEAGHIPRALNIERADIQDDSYPYEGMKAGKEQMEELFSSLGIQSEDTIVVYDDSGNCESARLWWILQNCGYYKIKILDGGLGTWKAANGSLSKETIDVEKSDFQFGSESNEFLASRSDVENALKGKVVFIDARTPQEYSGERLKSGARKAGRIPGSMNIDWTECMNYHDDKKLKSISELKAIFQKRGIDSNDEIIVYCHSGVRSSHTVFVLTQLLDYQNVKNYDGSWVEWSYHEELPIESEFSRQ